MTEESRETVTGIEVPTPGRSISTATGVIFGGVLPSYLFASLAIQIRGDFAFSNAELGLGTALSFALSAVIAPWAGSITDRLGIERGIYASTGLVVLACVLAATVAGSATAVIALMAMIGLGGGLAGPSASALLARDIRTSQQGTAFGLLTSAPQISAFAAGLALPLVAQPFGWRLAFVIAAVLSLLFAILIPRQGRHRHGTDEPRGRTSGARRRGVVMAAVASGLASAGGIGMRYFLVIFLIGAGFSEAEAGFLLGASAFVAVISRFGVGILADRRPGDSFARAAVLMLICALGFGALTVGGTVPIVIGAMLAGGIGWGWQAPLSYGVIQRNRDAAAEAVGFQLSGFFSGAVVGPLVVGLWAQQGNFTAAWITCGVLSLAAAAATLWAREIGRESGEAS